jgi:hypothetical protein
MTMEEVKKRFPTEGEETNSTMYAAEFGYAGGDPGVIEPKDRGFEYRLSDIEAWMSQQDWLNIVKPLAYPVECESTRKLPEHHFKILPS